MPPDPVNWPPSPPVLADDAVALRAWRDSDATAVFEACQDPEIQRWTRVPVPYLTEHAVGFVANAPRAWNSGGAAPFALVSRETDAVIGSCSLVEVDIAQRRAEVGYWVGPGRRGRGVAQRGLRLLSTWAMDDVGLSRLDALIAVANTASRAVAEHAGFSHEEERVVVHRGKPTPFTVFSRFGPVPISETLAPRKFIAGG